MAIASDSIHGTPHAAAPSHRVGHTAGGESEVGGTNAAASGREATDADLRSASTAGETQASTQGVTQGMTQGVTPPRRITAHPAQSPDSLRRQALPDSLAGRPDTTARDTTYVIILDPPAKAPAPGRVVEEEVIGLSWIVTALLLLFVLVAIRFRNNSKYLATLLKSAIEVRERGNVFDDTVRETSFVILLNAMWSICAGMLLYTLVGGSVEHPDAPRSMTIAIGLTAAYEIFMIASYAVVGTVFSDRLHTRMWIRGYLAATGLTTLILFPAALLTLCYPEQAVVALWMGGAAVALGKIVFISKGFRIFFTQISAWVLFLYYLCSLEIVPLILLYVAALKGCG